MNHDLYILLLTIADLGHGVFHQCMKSTIDSWYSSGILDKHGLPTEISLPYKERYIDSEEASKSLQVRNQNLDRLKSKFFYHKNTISDTSKDNDITPFPDTETLMSSRTSLLPHMGNLSPVHDGDGMHCPCPLYHIIHELQF